LLFQPFSVVFLMWTTSSSKTLSKPLQADTSGLAVKRTYNHLLYLFGSFCLSGPDWNAQPYCPGLPDIPSAYKKSG